MGGVLRLLSYIGQAALGVVPSRNLIVTRLLARPANG